MDPEFITPERVELFEQDPTEPILLACSDNGPQMTSKAREMDFNAGNSVGRRWAEPLAASGQLHGRHWAGSHGRRQMRNVILLASPCGAI